MCPLTRSTKPQKESKSLINIICLHEVPSKYLSSHHDFPSSRQKILTLCACQTYPPTYLDATLQ